MTVNEIKQEMAEIVKKLPSKDVANMAELTNELTGKIDKLAEALRYIAEPQDDLMGIDIRYRVVAINSLAELEKESAE